MSTTSPDPASAIDMESGFAESFDDWIRLVGNRFVPVLLSTQQSHAFRGSIRSRRVDGTAVTDLTASAHRVRRIARDITPVDPRHLKLTLQLEGVGLVAQDGRDAVLRPGDIAIYDTSRPYTLQYEGAMRALVMMFPHEMLGLSAPLVHTLTAVRLRGDEGLGRVIRPFMQHIAEDLDLITGVNGTRIVRSAFDLITALLSDELIHRQTDHDPWRATIDRIRLHIDAHLDDPELSAEKVARAHFVSLRQLQYLFREEGLTVAGYIRRQRLERCRLELEDPAHTDCSVMDIARRWGFVDPSHFSRAFKAEFETSPGRVRPLRPSLPAA